MSKSTTTTKEEFLRLLSKPAAGVLRRSGAGAGTSSSATTPAAASASASEISDTLKRLRRLILVEGIPDDDAAVIDEEGCRNRGRKVGVDLGGHGIGDVRSQSNPSTTRSIIWKILLQVSPDGLDPRTYLSLVSLGPSSVSEKIKNDTFRTLATDGDFKGKVKEEMLVRLLEAFVWRANERERGKEMEIRRGEGGGKSGGKKELGFSYVQGMNVLSAPFLYVLPSQIEAFACFTNFIERCCPMYVQPTLVGVHRGLDLLNRCLEAVDPELYHHLKSKSLTAELYAFPSVLTMCACTPPLDQVLKLWDFLLAFGIHLNILCIIAQLLLMRQDLMESPSPMRLLRIFPPLKASSIIGITIALVKDVPEELYGELVRHPYEVREED